MRVWEAAEARGGGFIGSRGGVARPSAVCSFLTSSRAQGGPLDLSPRSHRLLLAAVKIDALQRTPRVALACLGTLHSTTPARRAFMHLERGGEGPRLALMQAQFSDSLAWQRGASDVVFSSPQSKALSPGRSHENTPLRTRGVGGGMTRPCLIAANALCTFAVHVH